MLSLMISCSDESIESGPPEIDIVDPTITFIGDTVSIYGNFFGQVSEDNFVVINDSLIIESTDCMKWTDRIIRFEMPFSFDQGELAVSVGNSLSNKIQLRADLLPPILTTNIPSGTFQMGSRIGLDDEKPVHTVNITHEFEMTIYEITRRQYRAVMGYISGENLNPEVAAESIEKDSAIVFCNKLSEIQGFTPVYTKATGDFYIIDTEADGWRLPTEAEWEYACRAGSTKDFGGTGNLDDMGWYDQNSGYTVHSVGIKESNDFGLFDMHGNVWEWCWDTYDPNFYLTSPSDDPINYKPNEQRNVARGGSYSSGNSTTRASNRKYDVKSLGSTGFRIMKYIVD